MLTRSEVLFSSDASFQDSHCRRHHFSEALLIKITRHAGAIIAPEIWLIRWLKATGMKLLVNHVGLVYFSANVEINVPLAALVVLRLVLLAGHPLPRCLSPISQATVLLSWQADVCISELLKWLSLCLPVY